jgi:hypothetical protein
MRAPLLPLGILGLAAASVACSAPVAASSDGADAEAAASLATAVVVVERTSGPNDASRAEAVARFVQMRSGAVDDQALRMVGAAADFPSMDACEPVARAWGDAPARAVKLADVGLVSLEPQGTANANGYGYAKTSLVARQLPDVADLVSGVVYSARGADQEGALPSRARYALRVTGTAEVDPFEVLATAPPEPTDVRVDGQDARAAISLTPGTGAELAWDPGAAEDLVYVDVVSREGATPVVRCLFSDIGHATIVASAFGAIDEGTVSVHRLHRENFRAKGLDTGEVRFDFARAIPFTRR